LPRRCAPRNDSFVLALLRAEHSRPKKGLHRAWGYAKI